MWSVVWECELDKRMHQALKRPIVKQHLDTISEKLREQVGEGVGRGPVEVSDDESEEQTRRPHVKEAPAAGAAPAAPAAAAAAAPAAAGAAPAAEAQAKAKAQAKEKASSSSSPPQTIGVLIDGVYHLRPPGMPPMMPMNPSSKTAARGVCRRRT